MYIRIKIIKNSNLFFNPFLISIFEIAFCGAACEKVISR